MRRIITILFFFLTTVAYLSAKNAGALFERDSVMSLVNSLPHDDRRMEMLDSLSMYNLNPPHNFFYARQLLAESKLQNNSRYKNNAFFWLAICYDRKHDLDSIMTAVDSLKRMAMDGGNYDFYLQAKAAVSRVQASHNLYEKALYNAKEVLAEAIKANSLNGKLAAYNSLGCVSHDSDSAIFYLKKGYGLFSDDAADFLKVDILSRLVFSYGNLGDRKNSFAYLTELDSTLAQMRRRDPKIMGNYSLFEIDCEVKYAKYYLREPEHFDILLAHLQKGYSLITPDVDPVCLVNLQLIELQYYGANRQTEKSLALIEKMLPVIEKNHVTTYLTLLRYKAIIYGESGDIQNQAIALQTLLRKQDSLYYADAISELKQLEALHGIDNLDVERQMITNKRLDTFKNMIYMLLILVAVFLVLTNILVYRTRKANRKAAEALSISKAENEEKCKLQFDISHSIRTPLNTIIGFTNILCQPETLSSEIRKEYGDIIDTNCRQLLIYVQNVLELSRIQVGKTKYQSREMDIVQLITEEIAKDNSDKSNSITSTITQTSPASAMVHTDRDHLLATLRSIFYSPAMLGKERFSAIVNIEEIPMNDTTSVQINIKDVPLAYKRFDDNNVIIRNSINADLFISCGGSYEVDYIKHELQIRI